MFCCSLGRYVLSLSHLNAALILTQEEDPDPNKVLLSPTGINLLGRHRLVHKLDNGKRLLLDTSASAIQLANWFIALFPEARDWLLDNYTLPNPNALSLLRPAKRFGTLVDPVPQDVEFTAAHFLASNRAPYVLVMRKHSFFTDGINLSHPQGPYQTIPRDVWEQFGVKAGSAKEKAVEDNAVAGMLIFRTPAPNLTKPRAISYHQHSQGCQV